MKKISIGMLPPAVKRLAMVFSDIVEIYSCDSPVELINMLNDKPLEMMIIAQTDKNNKIEKHFLVGLAVPCKTDDFKNPLLYITPLTYEQYIKYEEVIKKQLGIKELSRKHNLWLPNVN